MSDNNKEDNGASNALPDEVNKNLPKRCIYNDADHEAWKDSRLKHDLLRVVGAMGKSCAHAKHFRYNPGDPLRGLSPAMACFRGSLEEIRDSWLDEIPPVEVPAGNTAGAVSIRFGNPAFQKWHARLRERSASILRAVHHTALKGKDGSNNSLEEAAERGREAARSEATLSTDDPPSVLELSCYLRDAFGHAVRLDYGTGHESSFMIVLYGACKLGWLDEEAAAAAAAAAARQEQQTTAATATAPSMEKLKATAISIFSVYLEITRQLQTRYRLEPAGSHGVWGLDDYHCLPFYFGACQCQSEQELEGDDMPEPSEITDSSIRQRHAENLLYFGCMEYICQLKRGVPLFECSPMLYDISQTCPTWSKVATGLLRLYEGEVLNKRQVVQHFTFGHQLFVATWTPSQTAPSEAPTTNFRTTGTATAHVAPMVRAPWADGNQSTSAYSQGRGPGRGDLPPMGRAPWANK